tara:strand:+ start:24 stop:452 length:429 start_codon:yes stop_codon:yes gene_type:complete
MVKRKVAGVSEFKIDASAGGTLTNQSAFIDTIDPLGVEFMQLDVTSFADTGERVLPGMQVGQEWSVSGAFEGTTGTGPDIVYSAGAGTVLSFEWYPMGTASNRRKYSGECMVLSYKPSGEAKGRVQYETRFKLDGTVTSATV